MKKGRDNKPHIGIFGRRNTGKSSFINVLVNQDIAIVSEVAGTTTDPVKKSIEIFGIGPAIVIDTAGIDDIGDLGKKRIEKTNDILKIVDCAVLVITDNKFENFEIELVKKFKYWEIPFMVIHNKSDIDNLSENFRKWFKIEFKKDVYEFSTIKPHNLDQIIQTLKNTIPETIFKKKSLLGDIIKKNDIVLLITPIDKEAPEGRMILPQQMAIRDVLDNHAVCITIQHTEVEDFLKKSGLKPVIAITDSQVFEYVKKIIPNEIPLTSFSVLFAKHRGDFENYIEGTYQLDKLKDNDRVLILESCTHQVNCDDIGRFKLPNWIREYSGKKLEFDIVAGLDKVTKPMEEYAMVVQCGGCMVTRKQLINRLKPAREKQIPVSNYGMSIAHINGILERAIEPFQKHE
jgi:[FeFe] hydrogenase H-cluster maturation GTPase HydF